MDKNNIDKVEFYKEAFSRNIGLIYENELDLLNDKRIAIAGLGGAGGSHAVTLARMGFSKFVISDDDTFGVANFNRQVGATIDTVDKSKSEVIKNMILQINPFADVVVFENISPENVGDFLNDADVYVDGMDFFCIDTRRLLFQKSYEKGIYAITAGPIGFSTACIVFSPKGMTFDKYFNINDKMSEDDMMIQFILGLTPSTLQLGYIDTSKVSFKSQRGPSSVIATNLCASSVAMEVMNVFLNRRKIYCAPYYYQFDLYELKFKMKYLFLGNRNPLQFIRKLIIKNILK